MIKFQWGSFIFIYIQKLKEKKKWNLYSIQRKNDIVGVKIYGTHKS